jgi:5-methylcytosine-specific restriction endonuclease McrA
VALNIAAYNSQMGFTSFFQPKQKPITVELPKTPKKRKQHIPVALHEAVWIKHMGRVFESKCKTTWCPNIVTVFDFQAGHDIPESKGGPTSLQNLYPICSRCNQSMGNRYTFQQWCKLSKETSASPAVVVVIPKKKGWSCFS